MYRVVMQDPTSLDEYKRHVRGLIAAKIAPADIAWTDTPGSDLFGEAPPADKTMPSFAVPAAYVELARDILCHRDGERFALLYELLWRILNGERALLSVFSDPLVYKLRHMQKSIRRDLHKMTAFVRFRKVQESEDADGDLFIAWFEPQHLVLRPAAEFFSKRFANMRWSILTPDGSLAWNGREIAFGPPVPKSAAPQGDALEEWWKSYYRSTFNPARANLKQMQQEMPARYWNNLPEASLIPELLAQSAHRMQTMITSPPTAPRHSAKGPVVEEISAERASSLTQLKAQAKGCERCPLYKDATQTVFGEGPAHAKVIFVGEQPGDQEDLAGKPFVGPAGQMFDRALSEAGVNRDKVYVTNAVKHFKFIPRGKKRIHQKPNAGEIKACRWWLEQEIELIKPDLIVALGATAARGVLGHEVKITKERGTVIEREDGVLVFITVHPSYLLRLPDEAAKREEYARFVQDLNAVAKRLPAVRLAA